ncbi:type II toxin-antitoxin system antitoxin SocA domain-containing protein [Spongiactinospora sp. TRM90649]|uniref:Panacea domain-containing protein n=1 Tax=Spongiactinospora sp. TRM90649 TaxID=3031114 RepID=UPI0023F7EE35|nr:type II toxin-antitoxin system antitoxin SocA domain-containing protein [Spongiactinospora sp. TRM90649]MDF5759200.1 DUF4065 domain-containing protein [Spongiactinospora sp. TRM90649]
MFDPDRYGANPAQATAEPYAEPMPASAQAIASVLRRRRPGMGVKKLHKLLYYAQGYHLAAFGHPLFKESISAWDMGPVVGQLWKSENDGDVVEPGDAGELDEAALNTIGYVLSRYGNLSAKDLENLTRGEEPWLRADKARPPGGSVRIEQEWMQDFFADQDDEEDGPSPDPAEVARMLEGIEERRRRPARPDSIDDIRAWLAARA